MHVCSTKRILQHASILVGKEAESGVKTSFLDTTGEVTKAVSAADANKNNTGVIFQSLCCVQDRIKFVGTSKISGITDHKLVLDTPFLS